MNWGIIGCGKIAEKFVQDLRLVEEKFFKASLSKISILKAPMNTCLNHVLDLLTKPSASKKMEQEEGQ